jgi:cell division protein FtsZ
MIFGAVIAPNMGDDLRVTVIATGFERTGMPRPLFERPLTTTPRRLQEVEVGASRQEATTKREDASAPIPAPAEFRPRSFNTDDLDIPTFLRKRGNR